MAGIISIRKQLRARVLAEIQLQEKEVKSETERENDIKQIQMGSIVTVRKPVPKKLVQTSTAPAKDKAVLEWLKAMLKMLSNSVTKASIRLLEKVRSS